jgi:hypothetical protein
MRCPVLGSAIRLDLDDPPGHPSSGSVVKDDLAEQLAGDTQRRLQVEPTGQRPADP